MEKRVVWASLALMLLMTALPAAVSACPYRRGTALQQLVEIHARNWDHKNVAFYYVYGNRIQWWQGGAKFILSPSTEEYKVIEEFMVALPSKLGIKVLTGELYLVEGYVKAKYVFDGIIQFKNYMFIDRGGIVLVEWEYGTGLNVTIYSKTTINMSASQISGYGFADWKKRVIRQVEICIPMIGCRKQPIYDSTPTAEIPAGSEVLIVPVEGVILEEVHRGYTVYLGGCPSLDIADASKSVKTGMIFWNREPDYWLVYNAKGLAKVWKIDNWFNKAVWIWPIPHEVKVASAR